MKIIGTDKIKGVLDLAKLKIQVAKGVSYTISSEHFGQFEVQRALEMGYIKRVPDAMDEEFEEVPTIELKNMHVRSLTISCINANVGPGQRFNVTEEQLQQGDIRAAISKGLLAITSSVKPTGDVQEYTMRMGRLLKDDIDVQTEDQSEDTFNEAEVPNVLQAKTPSVNPKAVVKPMSQKSENPTTVVAWNPTGNPLPLSKPMKDASVWDGTSNPVIKQGEKKKAVGRPKKPDKNLKTNQSQEMSKNSVEQEVSKILSATKSKTLMGKKKQPKNNNDVELLEK